MNPSTDSDIEADAAESQATSIESMVRSLRRLLEGDAQEQQETFDFLKSALEEDRPSNRRLFSE